MKALGDVFLDQQARSGAANLTLVEPDRVHHAFDRRVQVGVFEDDKRRFAAQLQARASYPSRLSDGAGCVRRRWSR